MKIIELLKVCEFEIFPNEIQIFSKTLFNLNGWSHVIFSLGFWIWKQFEFMEIINAKMKVWESPFIPSHLTFKSFKFHSVSHKQPHLNQTNNQNYLFNITFHLEFWDVTTGSAPCGEGKGLTQFEVVFLMPRLPGSEYAWPSFRSVLSYPQPPPGRSFTYIGWRPAAYSVPDGS